MFNLMGGWPCTRKTAIKPTLAGLSYTRRVTGPAQPKEGNDMFKYLRNAENVVVELKMDENAYIAVNDPSLKYPCKFESSIEQPVPNGFGRELFKDVVPVDAYTVLVACLRPVESGSVAENNPSAMPTIYKATVFASSAEAHIPDLLSQAEEQARLAGYRNCSADSSFQTHLSFDPSALLSNEHNRAVIRAALRWFQSCKNGEHNMLEVCDILDPDSVASGQLKALSSAIESVPQTESYATLVLSTAHLTQSDADNLEVAGDIPELRYWIQDTGVGFRIKLNASLLLQELESQGLVLSDSFRKLVSYAVACGYRALDLDRDADVIPGLESFDW